MSLIRRLFSRIATSATTIIAAIPMSAISSSPSKDDPVTVATRFHTLVFIAYVVILVLAALFQWWVWSTGNRLQDAIRANSDARIMEAKVEGAKANERAENLEHDNLTLKGNVAVLQTEASNAKAAQQKLEIELSKQREITAKAEKELFEVKQRLQPRRISPAIKAQLLPLLKTSPKGKIKLFCVMGDREAQDFVEDISKILEEAGWEYEGPGQKGFAPKNPVGIAIVVNDARHAPPYAAALQRAFFAVGIPLAGAENPREAGEGDVLLIVGTKPQ